MRKTPTPSTTSPTIISDDDDPEDPDFEDDNEDDEDDQNEDEEDAEGETSGSDWASDSDSDSDSDPNLDDEFEDDIHEGLIENHPPHNTFPFQHKTKKKKKKNEESPLKLPSLACSTCCSCRGHRRLPSLLGGGNDHRLGHVEPFSKQGKRNERGNGKPLRCRQKTFGLGKVGIRMLARESSKRRYACTRNEFNDVDVFFVWFQTYNGPPKPQLTR